MAAKRVLVAPLDWGLGHATRCIPIINSLLQKHIDVLIAGSGQSLSLLQQEFPELKSFVLPGYNPKYRDGSMVWQIAQQLPKFIRVISHEHTALQQLIKTERIDIVISDNRYGLWSHQVPSYFITHQTTIQLPSGWRWMQGLVNYFNRRQIRKFKECLIPDRADQFFSGILSAQEGLSARFIGPLSRFKADNGAIDYKYDILILLSGPEPQRSILEEILTSQIRSYQGRVLLVRGATELTNLVDFNNAEVVDFLTARELQHAINQSEIIISRSGYSTLMDLSRMGKKSIFIPTPGQTEQEYLARRFMEKGVAYSMSQNDFNLDMALKKSTNYRGFDIDNDSALLDLFIKELTAP